MKSKNHQRYREQQLVKMALVRNLSIGNGVIAFESRAVGKLTRDLFVYQVSTNTMFRVTNTPTTKEILSDVTVLDNGDLRVVWAADDDPFNGQHNIYARTFSLPPITNLKSVELKGF